MGGFSMNRVLGTIKKRPTFGGSSSAQEPPANPENDTPEAIATRSVKQFCQSVGSATGDDVTFLPIIVEAAVASPAAAAECARLIRKFMAKDYWSKASCQYNAIMLARILVDNPGPGFTKFMDKKFVDTTKELLRSGRDPSVRQILMESLDTFENQKAGDEGLGPLIEMWKKEKEKAYKAYGPMGVPVPRTLNAPPFNAQQPYPQGFHSRPQHSRRLPDPIELANRLEEARTSAKLLEQVVACTPPSEVLENDLIKEFSERCTGASRSIQAYMSAENPSPDNDTMESLIDTNEQLQQALNHHRRAVLQAKKQLNPGVTTESRSSTDSPAPPPPHIQPPPQRSSSSFSQTQSQSQSRPVPAPPVPSRKALGSGGAGAGKGKATLDAYDNHTPAIAGPSRSATATPHRDTDDDDGQDPFRDPAPEKLRLSFEPFHPGFGGSGSGGGGSGGSGGGGGVGGVGGSSSAAAGGTDKEMGGRRRDAEPVTPVSDDEEDAYRAAARGADKKGEDLYRY